MKKHFKGVALALATVLSVSMFAGCSDKKVEENDSKNSISYWIDLPTNTAQTASNLGETPFAKELMKKTGVDVEYIHPARGQAAEKFNIMLAMGKLPDIIEYNWNSAYPGGFPKALSDGVVLPIDMEKEAPNLYAYIKENPELEKMMKTDDGQFYGFPFIRGDAYLQTSAGPIVREDWLKELNMEYPETIDEWTAMLTAFKEKMGAESPLSVSASLISGFNLFVGAYGIADGFYIDGGQVKYGPIEDGYKDFLKQLNQWYKDGLLDSDFASIDSDIIQSNMLNGVAGAAAGSCGSGLGRWMAAAPDEKCSFAGVKYPVLNKGDKPQFGHYDFPVVTSNVAVISKDAKNKELCAKFLDYGYSEEGRMLFNFGIEGESYTMVDGYPTYTDLITKNPEGLSMGAALARYAESHANGPFIQDKRYMEQYANLPQQKTAITNWMDTDMNKHMMPPVNITVEQQTEIAAMKENIDTYKQEMMAKFIMGVEPISNFDKFRDELKKRGIEKYIKYQQEAFERWNNR